MTFKIEVFNGIVESYNNGKFEGVYIKTKQVETCSEKVLNKLTKELDKQKLSYKVFANIQAIKRSN